AEAGKSRSAFGRVMDVMISALQHQSRAQAQSAGGARTTAAGTPTGIEVGAAFSDALEAGKGPAAGAPAPGTGTGGAAAAEGPRAGGTGARDRDRRRRGGRGAARGAAGAAVGARHHAGGAGLDA